MKKNKDITAASKATVYSLFYAQVRRNPDAIALEYKGIIWSYKKLDQCVKQLATVFSEHGLTRGDRIAILSENRPEYVVSELACAMTGIIIACQNWRLSNDELQHCLLLIDPKLILVSARFEEKLSNIETLDRYIINFDHNFNSLLAKSQLNPLPQEIDSEDGLIILYTSGTTGLPKGALISHRAQIARMCALRLDCLITEKDAFVAWSPMFHMASTDQLLSALMSGSTVIIIDGLKLEEIVDAAKNYPLGWLVMLPGSIKPLIDYLKEKKPKLKSIACVGAMADLVPRQEIAELTKLLDSPYLNSFGSTETGLPPASANLIRPGDANYSLSKRLSSLCEVRLVNPDGIEVTDGEPGELSIRGPTIFSGYWNASKTNKKDFFEGWFRMGDLFRRNEDGSLDFIDRVKYMIKSGGENIYPAEIERVLLSDKRVSDAVVVRKADAKWGEVPVAFIARLDEKFTKLEVENLCRKKLAGYKRPKEVKFISLDQFPRSTTGKIQRHEMESWL